MELNFDQILAYWERRHPGQRIPAREKVAVRCAFHSESNPSCTLFLDGNGGFNCMACGAKGNLFQFEMRFSQCDSRQAEINIAEITGAKPSPRREGEVNLGPPVAIYDYRDESGLALFQKRRYEPEMGTKTFRSFHMTERGWKVGIDPRDGERTSRVLFNLPDLVKADVAILVEGEKCVQAVMNANLFPSAGYAIACTCTYDGAWKPGQNPKWLDSYSAYFAGKQTFILADNDAPGRAYAEYAAQAIAQYAYSVRIVPLPGLEESGDVSDFLATHAAADLEKLIESATNWTPSHAASGAANSKSLWDAQDMATFLTETEDETKWLIPDMIAPGCLTEIFAPRGLGKSLLANFWAVQLAISGLRVLILDRDNPRAILKKRLRSFGAEGVDTLKVIGRDKCPPLTKPADWAQFPYADYDVVIVDSLNAMAEGVGDQDSSAPARAMACLLDVCHRENGPAVLLLGNTVKNGAHSRGSGIIEDRADVVYEVRDGTDFKSSGTGDWAGELPKEGAADWAARSARRKEKTKLRLALVPTKFRDDREPAPRMFEINTEGEVWSVADVTASVDAEGEAERQSAAAAESEKIAKGASILLDEIDSRAGRNAEPIHKSQAENMLMDAGYTRSIARAICAHSCFLRKQGKGPGHPMELHRSDTKLAAEIATATNPNKDGAILGLDFCRPLFTGAAEIKVDQIPVNTGDLRSVLSAAEATPAGKNLPAGVPLSSSVQKSWINVEV